MPDPANRTENSSDVTQRRLLQRLESLSRAGIQQLPRKSASPAASPPVAADGVTAAPAAESPTTVTSTTGSPPSTKSPPPAAPAERPRQPTGSAASAPGAKPLFGDADPAPSERSQAPTLEVLRNEVAACTACGELASSRTQTVFGVGDPNARLALLGEAPGADEDRLGEPFVGRAGQLLDRMLSACKLSRDEVYLLNVLRCRPPGNRNPAPAEAAACDRFLRRQLELVDPEFVCCLGAVAAQHLLGVTTPIGRLRGRVHAHEGLKVVCTYHPAYLLRNPSAKRQAWEDLQFLMAEMGVAL